MMYTISALKRKAKEAGYTLCEGYQKYYHTGWGYRTDSDGQRIRGFEIYDPRCGYTIFPKNDMWSYGYTLDEVFELLKELCEAKEVKI